MPATPEPVASLREVTKRFDGALALDRVNVDLRAGAVHALVGENGSGKSTAVRVLTGAISPDGGDLVVGGSRVTFTSPRQAIAAGIVAAYQESALVPALSVAENVVLGHERARAGVITDPAGREARPWLERVGLTVSPAAPVGELSVAEQQLVAIAKALSRDARLLILDEPTAALNGVEVAHLLGLVGDLREAGLAVLYITHRLAEVGRIADTVTVLKDGRVVTTRPAGELDEDAIVSLMVGRAVEQLFPPRVAPGRDAALHAEDLRSADGAVAAACVDVRVGEIVGIAGLEGSGRATLARMLAGVEPRARGRLRLAGRELRRLSPRLAVRRGLGFVPPDRRRQGVVPAFTVRQSITLSALSSIGRLGLVPPARERARAERFVKRFAIRTAGLRAPVRTLSGGNQQKVVLARALCPGARVVVCDEPTAGVDVGARREIYDTLAELAGEGVGVVVSSSDMLELLGLCHRILVMREGRVSGELPVAEASEAALMRLQLPKESPLAVR